MLKLVVSQQGLADKEFVVSSDVATVGRVSSCDVQIDEPFVSKQHLRIFHGTVVVDLNSSNGTFVDGRRVTNGVLLEGRPVEISQNGVELTVVAAEGDTAVPDAGVEKLRSEYALLEAEAARMRRELEAARSADQRDELVARLQGENETLRERLESLKAEVEGREVEDGESLQAKLAMQRVENVQELNEGLQGEIDRLRIELEERDAELEVRAAAAAPASPMAPTAEVLALQQEVTELRAEVEGHRAAAHAHTDQTDLVRKLRKELEALRSQEQAGSAPDLEQALRASTNEAAELRARVAELEGRLAEQAPPAPEGNVSDLFFKLQKENVELKRRVAALEGGEGGQGEAGSPRDMKTVKELMEARLRIAALETELSNLKVTSVPSLPKPAPAPSQGSGPGAGNEDVRQIFELLVEKDIEGLVRPTGGAVETFVLIESVRLLRHVERVVTRVAGDLIQLFQLQTMLPDTVGTYRDLVSDLLGGEDSASARAHLVDYLETLGRWLVASIGAHRKAAVLFADKIKDDLTEKNLVARDPLPPYARVPMLAGNELWRRVQDYLIALSPDNINEGIDDLAREQAQRILNENA